MVISLDMRYQKRTKVMQKNLILVPFMQILGSLTLAHSLTSLDFFICKMRMLDWIGSMIPKKCLTPNLSTFI